MICLQLVVVIYDMSTAGCVASKVANLWLISTSFKQNYSYHIVCKKIYINTNVILTGTPLGTLSLSLSLSLV